MAIFWCSRRLRSGKKPTTMIACLMIMLTFYIIFTIQETQHEIKKAIDVQNVETFLKEKLKGIFQTPPGDDLPECVHVKKWKPYRKSSANFELVVPHIEPYLTCEDRLVEMVIVVNSACVGQKNQILRKAIRKTWANSTALGKHGMFRVFFSLGLCSTNDNEENVLEALQNNDLVVGNFTDTYRNIKYKTFMALQWGFNMFSSSYIVKTDNDVYLKPPLLLHWLYQQNITNHFYGGFLYTSAVVFREPESPWFISKEQFSEDVWPPFALGACTVFSTNSIPLYLNYTQYKMPFNTDDAYIGVIARDMNINAVLIPGVKLFVPRDNITVLRSAIVFGDGIDGPSMEKYFNIFNNKSLITL